MTTTIDAPTQPAAAALPPVHRLPLRLHLLVRSVPVVLTALLGIPLFVLWVVIVALSPLSIVAPLLIPVTWLVRTYANAHRRDARVLVGDPLDPGYRRPEGGPFRRVLTILKDPASWRDAAWCIVHAAIGFATALIALVLFLGGVFYLVYPFLYWVTPQAAFGRPFGGLVHLHSVAQASALMPLALVCFGLWWALSVPLARAELTATRALLGRR